MSTTTSNLGLFKYTTDDHNVPFDYKTALNNNWDKLDGALINKATGTQSLTIFSSSPQTAGYGTNVGYGAQAGEWSNAYGYNAKATGKWANAHGGNCTASADWSVVLGHNNYASGSYSTALGSNANTTASSAIQIGQGTNSTANTLQIGFGASGNYQLLDGTTGFIPKDRLSVFTGANGSTAGTKGAVPQPTATDNTKFLKGDGTWATVDSGSSRQLGEKVKSNVPLSDASLKELDGSGVQKTGIYEDFVDYMEDLYDSGNYNDIFVQPLSRTLTHVHYVGNIELDGTIISGFTANTTYAQVYTPLSVPTSSVELVLKVKQTTLTVNTSITEFLTTKYGIVLRIANASTGQINVYIGNSAWSVNNVSTGIMLAADTWTWIKVTWNGTQYIFYSSTDGETWTQGATVASTVPIGWNKGFTLGGSSAESYPFTTGYIDLSECYINIDGDRVWSGTTTQNLTAKQAFDNSIATYGVCGKFCCDKTNHVIYLPKVNSIDRYLIDSHQDGNSWYRIYSDGFCEQGGVTTPVASTSKVIIFKKPYLNTDYNVTFGFMFNGTSVTNAAYISTATKATTGFTLIDASNANLYSYWEAKGYIDISDYNNQKIYEYIVVGAVTKSSAQIDFDNYATALNNKVDKSDLIEIPCLIETYSNGTEWYRIYSDGWCEQGGRYIITTTGSGSIVFINEFIDTNYNIFYNKCSEDSSTWNVMFNHPGTWTTAGVTIKANLTGYTLIGSWMACGRIWE